MRKLKLLLFVVFLLLGLGSAARAQRAVYVGFDVSATAFKGYVNPYDDGWAQILETMQGGDHAWATTLDDKGLRGAPAISFGIRPFSIFTDNRTVYNTLVKQKREVQRQALDKLLKNTPAAPATELIGLLHQAGKILAEYQKETKEIVVFTDGVQEGRELSFAQMQLSDTEIKKIIDAERQAGRLPVLNNIAIWFITGPSTVHQQISTSELLRVEKFWTQYVTAAGGTLKAFSPVLSNFHQESR